ASMCRAHWRHDLQARNHDPALSRSRWEQRFPCRLWRTSGVPVQMRSHNAGAIRQWQTPVSMLPVASPLRAAPAWQRGFQVVVSDIDVRLLRVFRAVVEAGSFANAQAILNVGASTISTQMSQLETRLGYV